MVRTPGNDSFCQLPEIQVMCICAMIRETEILSSHSGKCEAIAMTLANHQLRRKSNWLVDEIPLVLAPRLAMKDDEGKMKGEVLKWKRRELVGIA